MTTQEKIEKKEQEVFKLQKKLKEKKQELKYLVEQKKKEDEEEQVRFCSRFFDEVEKRVGKITDDNLESVLREFEKTTDASLKEDDAFGNILSV